MIDMSMISAVLGGIQQGLSAAQAILQMKTSAEVGMKVAEVVDLLHAAQSQVSALLERYSALQQRNEVLEKLLMKFKNFKREKKRYRLAELGPDAFAYVLDKEHQGDDPIHHACAACYQKSEIQILQFVRYESRFKVLACQACEKEIKFPHGISAGVITQPRIDRGAY